MVLAGDKWEVVYKTVLHGSLHLCNPQSMLRLYLAFGATLKFFKNSNFDRNQLKFCIQPKDMDMYQKKI